MMNEMRMVYFGIQTKGLHFLVFATKLKKVFFWGVVPNAYPYFSF